MNRAGSLKRLVILMDESRRKAAVESPVSYRSPEKPWDVVTSVPSLTISDVSSDKPIGARVNSEQSLLRWFLGYSNLSGTLDRWAGGLLDGCCQICQRLKRGRTA
jgi:hypothetical protein